ncbi:hypothetical protein AB852_28410 [Streptomyces uncialis]|uniref:Uncharacterized protein n=1 Tax=Streptomyces uncialis TaxID=1048205 RepID=A0A1Q4V0X6_9ACTN|nr:hypothetical protein AB852_28410 [Streptomyces uncialis]
MDLGDVPTWFGVAFAGAAAIAAVLTMRNQQTQLKEQRKFIEVQTENLSLERVELLAAVEDRREAQARQIRVTVSDAYVSATNGSNAPIHDVRCSVGGAAALRAVVTAPDESTSLRMQAAEVMRTSTSSLEVVGSGQVARFQRPGAGVGSVQVTFTDAHGYVWVRGELGSLRRVRSEA